MTTTNNTRTRTHRCYRTGLVNVIARCAPGCLAHDEATANLAAFDAKFYVAEVK